MKPLEMLFLFKIPKYYSVTLTGSEPKGFRLGECLPGTVTTARCKLYGSYYQQQLDLLTSLAEVEPSQANAARGFSLDERGRPALTLFLFSLPSLLSSDSPLSLTADRPLEA